MLPPSSPGRQRMTVRQIQPAEYEAMDLRVGRVVAARAFLDAPQPVYQLVIDLGPILGAVYAGVPATLRVPPEDLVDRLVVAVINLPPKRVAHFVSEVLVLGAVANEQHEMVLVAPTQQVAPGTRIR